MKKTFTILFLLLLMFPAVMRAQYTPVKFQQTNIFKYADPLDKNDKLFAPDKLNHFSYSMIGTAMINGLMYHFNVKNSKVKAAIIILAAGVAKEYLDPRPSSIDLTVDIGGVLAGYWLSSLSNKSFDRERAMRRVTVTNQIQ